jgi:hypothetical protein
LKGVEFADNGGPGDGKGFGREDFQIAVLVRIVPGGGSLGNLGTQETDRRFGIVGIGAGGGFLSVGSAVAVQVGLGIEISGEEFAVVVLLFPEVAEGVFVGVDEGECGTGQKTEARDQNDGGAGGSPDGLE